MNNLETHVLRLIAEDVDSPDVFTDDSDGLKPIRDSINDGIEELCMTLGYYRRKYLMTLHESRGLYRLNAVNDEIGWVIAVWDIDNLRPVQQTDLLNLASMDCRFLQRESTSPDYWWQMGWNHIGFFPRPATKGKVLELEMIAIPARYQYDQGPIRIREAWQKAVVFYAVSEFYASRGDGNRALEYLQKYLETAGIMYLHPGQAERQYRFGNYQRYAKEDST